MSPVVRKSAIAGLGAFATRSYDVGETILRIDDTRIVDAEHPLLLSDSTHHRDYLEGGRVVLMQSPERHINSSCCGVARCRGTIVSSFFELPLEWQREYLPLLSPWFVREHAPEIRQLKQLLCA